MSIKLTQEHLEHANLPPVYWPTYVKKIPDTMPYKLEIKKYLTNMERFVKEGVGVYLWSEQNSTGKTGSASIILKRAMELGYSGYFITSEDYKESLIHKDMFSEYVSVQQRAYDVDVLVLDDLTKEYRPKNSNENGNKGFAETKIEALLRHRVQHIKTTIFTGNRHPKELREIYGNDLAEMLKSAMKPIEVVGMDWRAERQKEINNMFKELSD